MKKIYALVIVAALLAGGAFAADFTGTGEIVELLPRIAAARN